MSHPGEGETTAKDETTPASPCFVRAEDLFEEMEALYKSVADRAFELFNQRGGHPGFELEDWFKAETEFLRATPVEVTEHGENLLVKLEAPGFTLPDLKISLEPRRLIISGKSQRKEEKREGEQVVLSERWSARVFREMTLPAEIAPAQVQVSLQDGILYLTLTKTGGGN